MKEDFLKYKEEYSLLSAQLHRNNKEISNILLKLLSQVPSDFLKGFNIHPIMTIYLDVINPDGTIDAYLGENGMETTIDPRTDNTETLITIIDEIYKRLEIKE